MGDSSVDCSCGVRPAYAFDQRTYHFRWVGPWRLQRCYRRRSGRVRGALRGEHARWFLRTPLRQLLRQNPLLPRFPPAAPR